jgi:hypothetical protein
MSMFSRRFGLALVAAMLCLGAQRPRAGLAGELLDSRLADGF